MAVHPVRQRNPRRGAFLMAAKIIDGVAISKALRLELAEEVRELAHAGVTPGLAVIIVGDDPASRVYDTVFPPCTPFGVQYLLTHERIPIEGQNVVVVGASNIVGKPMALMLSHTRTAKT